MNRGNPAGLSSRAIRLAEAGFAAIAVVLFAKVLVVQLLASHTQRRSDALLLAVSARIDAVAEVNESIATLHAEVQRVMSASRPAELAALALRVGGSESRVTGARARYESARRFAEGDEALEDFYRMTAVTRLYYATLHRVLSIAQRGDDEAARVLLHDGLDPTRVRQSLIAAQLMQHHAARASTLHGVLSRSRRTTSRVDFVANFMVLSLLLVVRRVVMRRLTAEHAQRAQHLAVLDARNRDLEEFAHRVAHDLKGLVNPITGYTSLISEAPDDSARVSRYAARISKKTDEVVSMIDELLHLARAGNVSRGPTALAPVAASVLEQFEAEIASTATEARVEVGDFVLNIGEVPLREVLQNLVQNALKYRAPDRALAISIAAVADDDLVQISVSDNGQGMSDAVMQHAHEPFFRATADRDVPGSGLGLAIVHRITTAHGGTLKVAANNAQGSVMTVSLPLWVDRPSAEAS